MGPERGIARLKEIDGLKLRELLDSQDLMLASVHESLGGAATVITRKADVTESMTNGTSPFNSDILFIRNDCNGRPIYSEQFPVTFRVPIGAHRVPELVVNPSIANLNRQQRAVALFYGISYAYRLSSAKGQVDFHVRLDPNSEITSDVLGFLNGITGNHQSMEFDLLLAVCSYMGR